MNKPIVTTAIILLLIGILSVPLNFIPTVQAQSTPQESITVPGSPFGVAAGFLYGYLGVKPYEFMPQLRHMGAGFTKVYLFWNQVEPQKGKYDWSAIDKFVEQLKSPDEAMISVFSSSEWAVKKPSSLLPPSPVSNPDDYYRFIYDLVKHCKGKVRYWQNDAEPNNPIYWSGTKEEFVSQLKVFYKAVKDADPAAQVVVGGYDGLFGPPAAHPFPNQQAGLDFFDYVLKTGHEAFDIFDLRLYGDPYTIEYRVNYMRQKMQTLGFDKPIFSTEYGGPNFFEMPANRQYFELVATWEQTITEAKTGTTETGKNKIEQLYDNMATLAPQTQMFMAGSPADMDAKYQRIQSRGIVMRNVFALAAGVQKTIYWYLPEMTPTGKDRLNLMALMYGKIGLIEFHDGVFSKLNLSGDTFQRMATALAGVRAVKRIPIADHPNTFLFEADRDKRGPVYIIWEQRDAFDGENQPPVPVSIPWAQKKAMALDALGQKVNAEVKDSKLNISAGITPIFVEPGSGK